MDIKYSESPISDLAVEVIEENDCSYMYLYTKEVIGKEVTENPLKHSLHVGLRTTSLLTTAILQGTICKKAYSQR